MLLQINLQWICMHVKDLWTPHSLVNKAKLVFGNRGRQRQRVHLTADQHCSTELSTSWWHICLQTSMEWLCKHSPLVLLQCTVLAATSEPSVLQFSLQLAQRYTSLIKYSPMYLAFFLKREYINNPFWVRIITSHLILFLVLLSSVFSMLETHKEYTVIFVLSCKSFVVTSLSILKVFFEIFKIDLGGGTSPSLKGLAY